MKAWFKGGMHRMWLVCCASSASLQRAQTNWCGRREKKKKKYNKDEQMKNKSSEREWREDKRGKHETAPALSPLRSDPVAHLIWESPRELSHHWHTDSTGQGRAVQELNGSWVIPIREETGRKKKSCMKYLALWERERGNGRLWVKVNQAEAQRAE